MKIYALETNILLSFISLMPGGIQLIQIYSHNVTLFPFRGK